MGGWDWKTSVIDEETPVYEIQPWLIFGRFCCCWTAFICDSMTAPRIPPSALKSGETDMPTTGDCLHF